MIHAGWVVMSKESKGDELERQRCDRTADALQGEKRKGGFKAWGILNSIVREGGRQEYIM